MPVKLDLQRFQVTIDKYLQKPAPTGRIVFYGSSTFTNWSAECDRRPLENDIVNQENQPVAVNRGFGGATAEELLYYYPTIVKPLAPRALVTYCFPNDRFFKYKPAEIVEILDRLFNYARTDFPGIKLYHLLPCLYEKQKDNLPYLEDLNNFIALMEQYRAEQLPELRLLYQVKSPRFFANPEDVGNYRKPRAELFIEDQMHLTQEGYDLMRDFFLEELADILLSST